MLIAMVLVGVVLSTGYATARLLGQAKGTPAAGLVPAAGLATIAILTTWCGLTGVPPPAAGVLVLLTSLAGIGLAVADRNWLGTSCLAFAREHRLAVALLVAALLVPAISMGLAFAQVAAPLSPHDGAFHVETTDAFRRGAAEVTWYPPGLAAVFGAVLQLMPWVDTAGGSFGLGLGLALLAPLVAFGLGVSLWRNLLAAATGALLISLTHLFTYYPQIWSGWPQLLGILLVLGLWLAAMGYLERPSWRWVVTAGVLTGAIVVVHGTELYSSTIVLVLLAGANWRRIPWRRLAPDVFAVVVLAAVCAAPYLPVLLHWAGGGGAYQAGFEDGSSLEKGASTSALQLLSVFVVDALGVDLPIRIVLVVLGLVWALRQRSGGLAVAVTVVFVVLAVVATLFNSVPLVRAIFAATYPWSLPYRHLTFASITLALIGGAGGIMLSELWIAGLGRLRGLVLRRLLSRLGRVLVLTWLVLSTWALTLYLSIESHDDTSFTSDDAAAMAWMRANVGPNEAVVNDTFADAGIWAPYKSGVNILFYRSFDDPTTRPQRDLVLDNVGRLDANPQAQAAACLIGARYVYYGAANSGWQQRSFPPVGELKSSPALQMVFEQGAAMIFRINLPC